MRRRGPWVVVPFFALLKGAQGRGRRANRAVPGTNYTPDDRANALEGRRPQRVPS